MKSASRPPLEVIYNGACPICAREIAHYRARAGRAGVDMRFTDLTRADLSAHDLTRDQAARRLHVLDGERVVSGIPAFALIWDRLPGFGWLARAARLAGVRWALDMAYNRVAAPWLYRRHLRRTGRA